MKVGDSQIKQKVGLILDRHLRDQGLLVSILQDIQSEYHYLPKDAIEAVSRGLEVPLTRVYSMATFFKAFSLSPRGRHVINACLGTACHVRGAVRIVEKIERELDIKRGETTEDMKFTLETVNCVGACALGPILIVDDEYSGEMTTAKVKPLLEKFS